VGLIHAYTLTPSGIQNYFGWMAAPAYAIVYAVLGLILLLFHFSKIAEQKEEPAQI
jgi:AGZA family xanthine/uracil permease-like MFS transporter